jgi:hypothetical protein
MRKSVSLLLYMIVSLVHGQQKLDTLFSVDLHYESLKTGPTAYFHEGDQFQFVYDGSIGSVDIIIKSYTRDNKFKLMEILLADSVSGAWSTPYSIQQDGCYFLSIEPVGAIGYSAGQMTVLQNHANKSANTCLESNSNIEAGSETFLTKSEILAIKWKKATFKVDKQISSGGMEYCEVELTTRPRQKVLLNFIENEKFPRTNILVFKHGANRQTTLLKEFQYGIRDFGFQSNSGGVYTFRFWGSEIFQRTQDIVIEVE